MKARHHAYFCAGDIEEGIASALAFGERALGLSGTHSDLIMLRHTLFSVDDARLVSELAARPPSEKGTKLIIVSASRIFHEAQNALLKTFEEPSLGTHLVLVVPSEGDIIATLRSRLVPLREQRTKGTTQNAGSALAQEFLEGTTKDREKIIAKILGGAASDKPEEKQAARAKTLQLVEGLLRTLYAARIKNETEELTLFLSDLSRLIPILHERSAPLKPILEHISLVSPVLRKY